MEWINDVLRDVAELPDRNSPAEWPEAMLVTAQELRQILEAHWPAPSMPVNARLLEAVTKLLSWIDDYAETSDPCFAAIEKLAEDAIAEAQQAEPVNARLIEALRSIQRYGLDTLSGRADGGDDDRAWQRAAVNEMTKRARIALSAAEAQQAEPVRLTDEQINGADGWLQEAPFWRVVKFARTIEAAVLRKNGLALED